MENKLREKVLQKNNLKKRKKEEMGVNERECDALGFHEMLTAHLITQITLHNYVYFYTEPKYDAF